MRNAHKLNGSQCTKPRDWYFMWDMGYTSQQKIYTCMWHSAHWMKLCFAGTCCLYLQYTLRVKAAPLRDYGASNPRKLYSLSLFYVGSVDKIILQDTDSVYYLTWFHINSDLEVKTSGDYHYHDILLTGDRIKLQLPDQ